MSPRSDRSDVRPWVSRSAPADPSSDRARGLVVAGLLMATQAVLVVGFAVFYGVELLLGQGEDRARVVMSIVVFLIGAGALGFLAWGLRRGSWWSRTPSVLWNVLLLPVAVSMAQAGQTALAAAIGALAVSTIAAVLVGGRR